MKQKLLLTLLTFLIGTPLWAQKIEIHWWHSMSGSLKEKVEHLVDQYNQSQEKFKVIASYRGNYTENLNAAIAAYRGKKAPHIVQVFEVGTLTMMNSQAIIPVQDLFKSNGIELDWNEFISPVLSYYQTPEGKLLSFPFNSSTPILYYNKDLLKKASIKSPPKTWKELLEQSSQLIQSGTKCGLSAGWQSWTLIENFTAIENIPFASHSNGFQGKNSTLSFNNPEVITHLENLKTAQKTSAFRYEGRRSDPSQKAFTSQKCAFYIDSSAAYSAVKKISKFNWDATSLPSTSSKAQNSIIGGASLWVFKGHSKREYEASANFLNFLSQTKNQVWWHQNTGYLPITKAAYLSAKKDGYYQKEPVQAVAIQQLLRAKPSQHSKGIRLGNFTQIREIINEELEKLWAGQKTPTQALNSAVTRGNKILKRYARTVQ